MSAPTCRGLLDTLHEDHDDCQDDPCASLTLASRVERVLTLPPESERPGGGPESEHWYSKGYNAALAQVRRILDGLDEERHQ